MNCKTLETQFQTSFLFKTCFGAVSDISCISDTCLWKDGLHATPSLKLQAPSKGAIDNTLEWLCVIAWHRAGGHPLPEPMLIHSPSPIYLSIYAAPGCWVITPALQNQYGVAPVTAPSLITEREEHRHWPSSRFTNRVLNIILQLWNFTCTDQIRTFDICCGIHYAIKLMQEDLSCEIIFHLGLLRFNPGNQPIKWNKALVAVFRKCSVMVFFKIRYETTKRHMWTFDISLWKSYITLSRL